MQVHHLRVTQIRLHHIRINDTKAVVRLSCQRLRNPEIISATGARLCLDEGVDGGASGTDCLGFVALEGEEEEEAGAAAHVEGN